MFITKITNGNHKGLRLSLIIGVSVLLGACGSSKQLLQVNLKATDQINRSEAGSPLPVIIRIYQLRDDERFEKASFRGLWKQDQNVLGRDLVEQKEITLHPLEERVVELEIDLEEGVSYVGVVALFRNPHQDGWRKIFPVEEQRFFSWTTPVYKLIADQHSLKTSDKE